MKSARSSRALSWLSAALASALLSGNWAGPPVAAQERVALPPLRVALLPFADDVGFQGKWDLAWEVPGLLGRHLDGDAAVAVVPMDSVESALGAKELAGQHGTVLALELGRRLEADLVVTGRLERFGVRRFSAGDPNLVGYKSYRAQIEITDVELIRVATEQIVATFDVVRDSVARPFALDLFGKPRKQDREFRELFEVEFGSPRFHELSFGQLADGAFAELSARIVRALVERPPLHLVEGEATVLAVDGREVYLSVGSGHGVEPGDLLSICRGNARIAVAEVVEIIGERLCKARILGDVAQIRPMDRVGERLSREGNVEEDQRPSD